MRWNLIFAAEPVTCRLSANPCNRRPQYYFNEGGMQEVGGFRLVLLLYDLQLSSCDCP